LIDDVRKRLVEKPRFEPTAKGVNKRFFLLLVCLDQRTDLQDSL